MMEQKSLKNPDKRIRPNSERFARWLKKNLFSTPTNSVITMILLGLLLRLIDPMLDYFVTKAVWEGNATTCRTVGGACFVFLKTKFSYILFGMYPKTEIYRPVILIFIFIFLLFYSSKSHRWGPSLLKKWFIYFIFSFVVMRGGILGIPMVDSSQWGGLPLTLIISTVGIIFSYPIGILLALARRSNLPIIKAFSVVYIELIRGIPLISLLFMSSVMLPLFLPEGVSFPKLVRAQVALIMFISAYMAEVIRGGLQIIPKGQYEAAHALGLNYFQTMRLIILPQALKVVIPPTVNTAIGMFKDTSLVIIIALFDLMYTTKSSLSDPDWLGFTVEAYAFAACIYFVFCFTMSQYSKKLEKELTPSRG